jgi:hypothetical protein
MTLTDTCNFFISRSAQITNAISIGMGWDVWTQVDFLLSVRRNLGMAAAREVPYPWSSKKRLDMLIENTELQYAIEMKAESTAGNTPFGIRLLSGIGTFSTPGNKIPLHRWVIGIGYSTAAKNDMSRYAHDNPEAVYRDAGSNGIGVITINVIPDKLSLLL